jgi:hypothetical protein
MIITFTDLCYLVFEQIDLQNSLILYNFKYYIVINQFVKILKY